MTKVNAVIEVPCGHNQSPRIKVGAKVKIERDPYDEPLPVFGTIIGIRVNERDERFRDKPPFYTIVCVKPDNSEAVREFDLDDIFVEELAK